jgi:hypothetical protein
MSKKFSKVILVVALFAFLGGQAFAYKYVMNHDATFSYVSATNQITSLTSGDFDDGYYDYALGDFDFYYYGRQVTHMRISTNGYIVFGFGSATGVGDVYTNTSLPDNATPNSMAAVNWADWDLILGGTMWYDVTGTAPNRTLIIEWRDIASHEQGTEAYKFEVIFYETSNEIRFQYEDVLESTSHDFGNKSTVGVEHPTSLQAEQFSFNSPDLSDGQAILFTPFVHVYDSTDFDGDGKGNPTIFRHSDHTWYIRGFGARTTPDAVGDIPVPGDYDGDGRASTAEYQPSTSTWYTEIGNIVFGTEGDIPVPADYDGDGVTDIAVWRPSDGTWYVYGWGARTWGTAGDIPVPADMDGDGADDFVIWRPSDGIWYVFGWGARTWGTAGDIPVPADIDGDGADNFVVWRPSDGIWYVRGWGARTWGTDGDIPVPGDLKWGSADEIVVWRPSDSIWYIRKDGAPAYGTLADIPMLK